ncbi:hypothetical protein H0G86_005325 [Trichoderma simmonsii]|uniref:Uncharacterized protein n=1 Tax=Trichoderma simmonsii TaxID=1491479 RepID=A0A8G0PCY9_9HYPO|nr:hypothetical protein H0G86_005325 [Trichoderma simmonsii]
MLLSTFMMPPSSTSILKDSSRTNTRQHPYKAWSDEQSSISRGLTAQVRAAVAASAPPRPGAVPLPFDSLASSAPLDLHNRRQRTEDPASSRWPPGQDRDITISRAKRMCQ